MSFEKRKSHKEALLALLSDGRPHHMSECLRVGGFRYGGRIHELRKQGHEIATIRLGDDEYSYQLMQGQGALL